MDMLMIYIHIILVFLWLIFTMTKIDIEPLGKIFYNLIKARLKLKFAKPRTNKNNRGGCNADVLL